MPVRVHLRSGERRVVHEADGAHIHGDFFVVTQGARDQARTVLTLWAPSVIYAEVRHDSGGIKLVKGAIDARCGQCANGWICELHPYQPWPHDDCEGPRTLCENPNCPHRWRTVTREAARPTDLRCRSCRQALVVIELDTPPVFVMRCDGCGHRWKAEEPEFNLTRNCRLLTFSGMHYW
ncbi:MAG: hypothetical protein ACRD3G_21085 [Vicinamibacterales bacterium]